MHLDEEMKHTEQGGASRPGAGSTGRTTRQGRSQRVDLLLGPTLAREVLRSVRRHDVGIIWVAHEDEEVTLLARRLGLETRSGPITEASGRFAVSVHYPRILTPGELALFEGAYNVHPGWLPWGRGFYPWLWVIVAGEPAGATIHRMTVELDRGPVVDRTRAEVPAGITAGRLVAIIHSLEMVLFRTYWPRLVAGQPLPERPQDSGGSYHSRVDAEHWRGQADERAQRAFSF